MARRNSKLDPKKRYLQVALNGTLEEAKRIINELPVSDRIIIEAGTPLIKRYGEFGISQIRRWYAEHLLKGLSTFSRQEATQRKINTPVTVTAAMALFQAALAEAQIKTSSVQGRHPAPEPKGIEPYIVADLKTMDRAETEVEIAAHAGASAAIALGAAPIETLNSFIEQCAHYGLDAMIDMMNVEYPLTVLRSLKKPPAVVIVHRGVDEEKFNKEKQIPLHEIRRVKGSLNIMVSIAGGDTLREVQRSIFNDADIVVIWKSVYQETSETGSLVSGFLKEIK